MHGDRSQEERNEALRAFKNRTNPVMVATDVLSRGIDIDDVSLIVNYDVPNSPEDYFHRIGRTGRYDKSGTAITFVSNKDKKYYYAIKKVVGDQLTVKDVASRNGSGESKKKSKSGLQKPKKEEKQQSRRSTKSELKERPTRGKSSPKESSSNNQKSSKPADKSKNNASSKKSSSNRPPKRTDKRDSGRAGRRSPKTGKAEEDIFQPEATEKALSRNRNALKPAKGIWRIIKSLITKIGL
jgi:superfamily II DNA/RNA helicase